MKHAPFCPTKASEGEPSACGFPDVKECENARKCSSCGWVTVTTHEHDDGKDEKGRGK